MKPAAFDDKDTFSTPRPARPRRAKRRRKAVMGLLPRYVLSALAGIVTIFACCAFVSKIAQPYGMQRQQGAQIATLKSRLANDAASNQDLQRQIAFVQRPEGVETAARAEGFLKPGEESLEVTITPPATPTDTQPGFSGMIARAWSHLTRR